MIVTVPDTVKCMQTFDELDFNKAGTLNVCELEGAVNTVWPNYQHKSAIMRAYRASDVNKDGFIGRNEFELFLRFLAFYNNLWCQVVKTTEDKNNFSEKRLYRKEFLETASRLSITHVQETFDEVDVDSKGYVLFEEFCTWMAKKSLNLEECQGGSFRFANAGSTRAFSQTRQERQQQQLVLQDEDNARPEPNTNTTYLTRLVLDLKCSVDFLNGQASDQEVETWAILIHDCMSHIQRAPLLGIDTMFEISHGADPIQLLAIYFSHVVSFEMDGGRLCRHVQELVQDVLELLKVDNEPLGSYFNLQNTESIQKRDDDQHVAMVMTVFGVKRQQRLEPHVKDKLLCAIVAVRVLRESLTMAQLVKVVACIEATTPFSCGVGLSFDEKRQLVQQRRASKRPRIECFAELEEKKTTSSTSAPPTTKKAYSSLQDLYNRMEEANQLFSLGLSAHKLVKSIQRAADVVNRFRGVFASTDMESYLTKVWGLLPQFNPALRQPKLYTVGDYHMAVMNLERLVATTQEESRENGFFVSFRGVPDAQEVALFLKRFQQNSQVGKLYIQCKAVSCSIISAFSELTGGDVPFCFLVGDSVRGSGACGSRRYSSDQMGYGLPILTAHQFVTKQCPGQVEMYNLLSNTIHNNMEAIGSFDVTNWSVTAFAYGMLGKEGIDRAMQFTAYPMTQDRARALLSCLPLNVVIPIGKEIARIAVSRTDKVNELLDELSPPS